jgi:hypothetical protein
MIVRHERSGGFAGISVKAEIDSETLSAKEANELKKLVGRAFPSDQSIAKTDAMPDQYNYSFTVEDNKKKRTVEVNDENITDEIRALSKWLIAKAIEQKK